MLVHRSTALGSAQLKPASKLVVPLRRCPIQQSVAPQRAALHKVNAASIEVNDDELMNMFSTTVRRRINKLKELKVEKEHVDAEYFKEKLALDKKFVDKYGAIFDQRKEVISGSLAVPDYNLTPLDEEDAKDSGIPDFWLLALTNNDIVNNEISDADARVLSYLTDIRYDVVNVPEENCGGFTLTFHFRENPYFKNEVLTKTYILENSMQVLPKRFDGTKIDWYPGKNTTVREVKKKVKSRGKVTVVTKQEPVESFFNLFNPPVIPEDINELEDEELDDLSAEMDRDYEIGVVVRELVIMDALDWFTGEAVPEDDYEGGEFDEGEYEEYEEEEVPVAKKGGRPGLPRR